MPEPTDRYIPSWEQAAHAAIESVAADSIADEPADEHSRRRFLTSAGRAAFAIAGLGAGVFAATSHGAAKTLTFKDIPSLGLLKLPGLNLKADVHVLNYALALEDLEAELYRQCVARLTTGGVTQLGAEIPGLHIDPYMPDVYHIQGIAKVEAEHRDFLRGALKLDGILRGLGIAPKKYDFGIPTKSREEVLALLIDVEATGAAAYLGAIPYFGTKIFLTTAAGIQGTEARHTAALQAIQNRLVMDGILTGGAPSPPAPLASMNHGIDTPMDPDAVLAKVSPFIVG